MLLKYRQGFFGLQAGIFEQFEAHVQVWVLGNGRNDLSRQFDDHLVGRQSGKGVEQSTYLGRLLFRQGLIEGKQIAKFS